MGGRILARGLPCAALLLLLANSPPAPGKLAMFAPLVGSCWTASIAAHTTDTHCFSAVYGGAHVRDRHRVTANGKVVYRGETVYSAAGDGVEFVYLNSLGGVGHGLAQVEQGGISFVLTMRASPADPPRELRSSWRWLAPGGGFDMSSSGSPPWRFTRGGRPERGE